jgi:hypothetical protein
MSKELLIPVGCHLAVSKETYDKFEEALIRAAAEKFEVVISGALGGVKIFVQPYIPNDTILVVGPDPDFPGRTKVFKIIKLSA